MERNIAQLLGIPCFVPIPMAYAMKRELKTPNTRVSIVLRVKTCTTKNHGLWQPGCQACEETALNLRRCGESGWISRFVARSRLRMPCAFMDEDDTHRDASASPAQLGSPAPDTADLRSDVSAHPTFQQKLCTVPNMHGDTSFCSPRTRNRT